MNVMNTYTLAKINDSSVKYRKILDYVDQHREESWKRIDLLALSGYISEKQKEDLCKTEVIYEYRDLGGFKRTNVYKTHRKDGWGCYITAAMREAGVLKYDRKTRRWSIGDRFDEMYSRSSSKEAK